MAEQIETAKPGVETVDWEQFWERKGGLEPGQHVSVFGPTGYGKTYTLIFFAEDFPGNSVLVVTKGRDEIVQRLVKERGWTLTHSLDDIFTDSGRPGQLLRKSWGDRWERRERPPRGRKITARTRGGQVSFLYIRSWFYVRTQPGSSGTRSSSFQ